MPGVAGLRHGSVLVPPRRGSSAALARKEARKQNHTPSRITRNREGEERQIPSGLSFERDRPTSGGVQEIRDMATEGEQGMSHFFSKFVYIMHRLVQRLDTDSSGIYAHACGLGVCEFERAHLDMRTTFGRAGLEPLGVGSQPRHPSLLQGSTAEFRN